MNSYDDRDVLAAIAAAARAAGNDTVRIDDVRWLVDAEYSGDLDDNVDRLIKRGYLEAATFVDADGHPLGPYDTPPVVLINTHGWYELWRR